MPRRSQADVAAGRQAILGAAVVQASVLGFEAVSIGRLAAVTGMSKSGLIRHFGDKEQLQLAAFQAGVELFTDRVWRAVEDRPAGMARLLALCDAWLAYHADDSLPGGCLVTTAVVEFDARPGAVHDAVAAAVALWLRLLEREAARAVADGDLPRDRLPADVAFELNALASSASTGYRLSGDPEVLERARRLMRRTLGRS